MPFVRAIGRWSMIGLIVGNIIGAGIFGVTGELTRLLGRPSPLAMVLAALGMDVIMASIAEVASQFSEAGGWFGPYPRHHTRNCCARYRKLQATHFASLRTD
jgi:amino acid transporter